MSYTNQISMQNNPREISTAKKMARNSIFNIIGHLMSIPIMIVIAPYMIKELGNSQYGIWALAGVVTSYAQLSDMGITKSLVKFVAEDWVHKDAKQVSTTLSTAFFTFAVVGGIVLAIILGMRHAIVVNLLKVPQDLKNEALFVVSGVALIFYANLLFSVYNSALQGIQRIDVVNTIQILSNVFRALGIYLFLYLGWGLKGLIINGALFSAIGITVNVAWAKKLIRGVKIRPQAISFVELRRIWGYSINVFISSLLGLFQNPVNKLILSHFTSLVNVTFYQLGNQIQGALRTVFEVGINPLLPAASELQGSKDNLGLERIYFGIMRILFLILLPCFVIVMVLAKPLFQVWLGEGYELASVSLQFLLFAHLISMMVLPQYIILMGIGRPRSVTVSHIISAGTNTLISLVLASLLGLYGVLIGEAISYLLAAIYLQVVFGKFTEIRLGRTFFHLPWKGIMLSVGLGALSYMFVHQIHEWSFIRLLAVVFSYFILNALLLVIIKEFDETDKRLFSFAVKTIRGLIPVSR